eukprot:TRINITY_DN8380_c0_g1_i1.p1 TRINITY_DN8380_c0_g1~~TRINITY_DN8380_c0_g1_i1.p1  ORF type:complete len:151 (-),score=10.95 TRINITY_DN8380_c0_g1_i1:317-769(-)
MYTKRRSPFGGPVVHEDRRTKSHRLEGEQPHHAARNIKRVAFGDVVLNIAEEMVANSTFTRGTLPCAVCLGHKACEQDKCTFCEKIVCDGCTIQCEKCLDLFCSFCSTSNYDMRCDRTFCLTCNDEERKATRGVAGVMHQPVQLEQMVVD